MGTYRRVVEGAEAGAIAAAVVELSFFVLDLVRLQPLATPAALSGVVPGPNGILVDLSSFAGVVDGMFASYQIGVLTAVHFLTFGLVGVVVSLLFDWRQPLEAKRLLLLATLCSAAFFGTVAASSSVMALDAVGLLPVLGANVLAAVVLGGTLRLVCMVGPDVEELSAGGA